MEEAYKRYMNNWAKELPRIGPCTQEEFINKIKTDDVFAKKWGVTVEVRELSLEERHMLVRKNYLCPKWDFVLDEKGNPVTNPIPQDVWYDNYNIPRRAISLTYNNKTIEMLLP
jgi:hypothetical protein